MKLRIELSPDADDEVVIRCKHITDDVRLLQDMVNNVIEQNARLVLTDGKSDCYIPRNELLFFETNDGRTSAHTAERMYYTDYTLRDLERILPPSFIRVSKSCILNAALVESVTKNLTGASEVAFRGTRKRVYVSRMYFKTFKEKMDEMRYSL